ncbi:MAG: FKBP-type peptidyl-prolyl cis-trans isomerase [Reichenbachiella sp.]
MKYLVLVSSLFLFLSCADEDEKDYTAQNEKDILAYIAENDLDAQRSESGLHYVIYEPGAGAAPNASSNVTVAYKGYYLDGSVFDESTSTGISFGLGQVINGWTEGITYFKPGGSGILLIPAHLGYGNNDSGRIPGGSVLIFDITLISVN